MIVAARLSHLLALLLLCFWLERHNVKRELSYVGAQYEQTGLESRPRVPFLEDPETFSASTRAVIGQFTVHILLYDPLKFKVVFVDKLFRD